jgi:hypothetical protein
MIKNKPKTLRDLILMVENQFKKYQSKGQIVNDVLPEDMDSLLDLVRNNPDEYDCIKIYIQDRTRVLIQDQVNMYSN